MKSEPESLAVKPPSPKDGALLWQKSELERLAVTSPCESVFYYSPIGSFCLNKEGRIVSVNRIGSMLLGAEQKQLIHRSIVEFMPEESRMLFLSFLDLVFIEPGKQRCDIFLTRADKISFPAGVHGILLPAADDLPRFCQVAILDMTDRIAEENLRIAGALKATDQALQNEIIQRHLAEKTHQKDEARLARLLNESNLMKQQLKHLSHKMLYIQENERKRISHELHDEITQTLVGINVHLESLVGASAVNQKELKKNVMRTQRLVKKSITSVHRFARELRPTTLDDLGLIPSLHSFMKSFKKKTGLQVSITSFDGLETLNSTKRTVLYRVAHEALINVAQHAEATMATVSFQCLPKALLMKIEDNGKSFDVEKALHPKKNKRLGLIGMRERIEMINGQFSIESIPGKGTTIQARIPFIRRPMESSCK